MNKETLGPCPQCGGPLDMRLKASVQCVCPYCGSLVVREGESLARFGQCAQILESVSPLRLGTRGVFQQRSFELIGRRQVAWERGFWEEWYVAFGRSECGWLTDAQGCFAFLKPTDIDPAKIDADVRVGAAFRILTDEFRVVDIKKARIVALEGELPEAFRLNEPYLSIDCVSEEAHLCTVEISPRGRSRSLGRYVDPQHLELRDTREDLDEWR